MDINTTSLINNLHGSQAGSVQASAQLLVLKKAMNLQGQGAMALLASVQPQPPLATSGNLGTQLNVYA
ncbi:putative motility protein [Roseateles cavernae]|uniref:putative motility protein n=1 Tax=Roseateles cavernae TaxID=3153578 RepID=UPI0032E441DE